MTTPLHGNVEYVNIDSLETHPENPRQGDIGAISTSITENGWFGTVVAQISSRRVLAGNHRLQAARIAGLATIPVFWVDCDDTQARKILIADNRMSDLASWDELDVSWGVLDFAGIGTTYMNMRLLAWPSRFGTRL